MDGVLRELAPLVGSERLGVQGLHSQESQGNWPDRVVGEELEESHSSCPCHPHLQSGEVVR